MPSILHSAGEVFHRIMGDDHIVELSHGLPVWRTKAPWSLRLRAVKQYEQKKEELLALVLQEFLHLHLSYSENPIEDGVNGSWENASDSTWIVPNDVDSTELYLWLYLGNWLLYKSDSQCDSEELAQLSSGKAEEVLRMMEKKNVRILIDSFHDNDPWTLAVNRAKSQTIQDSVTS